MLDAMSSEITQTRMLSIDKLMFETKNIFFIPYVKQSTLRNRMMYNRVTQRMFINSRLNIRVFADCRSGRCQKTKCNIEVIWVYFQSIRSTDVYSNMKKLLNTSSSNTCYVQTGRALSCLSQAKIIYVLFMNSLHSAGLSTSFKSQHVGVSTVKKRC